MKKNSFVVYSEYLRYFDKLSLIEKGKLIDALLRFSQDLPVEEQIKDMEASTEMAFMFISNQMSLDAQKYDRRCETSRQNGSKGGAPKGNKNAKKLDENDEEKQPKQPKNNLKTTKNKPNDNENDNDNDFQKENKKRKSIILADDDIEGLIGENFRDEEVANKFREFIQMRKAKGVSKAVRTKATFDGLVRDLRKFAGKSKKKALAILDKGINNCWQGLFDIPDFVEDEEEGVPYAN